jgi:hypothetical protein
MKQTLAAAAAFIAISQAGCARLAGDADLRQSIELAIGTVGSAGSVDSGAVDLTRLGSRDWTRMCILKPYTNAAEAEKVLGFKWNSEEHTSIAANDGIAVVVLATSNAVLSFTEYGRGKGDFAATQPGCVPRSQAIVIVQTASDGWRKLAWRT